jgi:hypothetical protein
LSCEEKDEKILNDTMGEYYELKVTEQKLPLLDLLNKVASMSDRFPLPGTLAVLPTSTVSYE